MANTIKKFEGNSVIPAEYGTELWQDAGVNYWSISNSIPADTKEDMATNMGDISTTSAAEKAKVKANSNRIIEIDNMTKETIRNDYSLEDELSALRTSDTAVTDAISAIVAAGTAKKAALGF
jgi:hypothetical protein